MTNMAITIVASLVTGFIVGVWLTAMVTVGVKSYLTTRTQDRAAKWQARALKAEQPEYRR